MATPDDRLPSVEEAKDEAPAADQDESIPGRRSKAFTKALLGRLPQLGHTTVDSSSTLNVYKDMQGVFELDADALLEPLQKLIKEGNG